MKFVNLNFKYLLVIITILVTINLYCVNSSENVSSIKTNTLLKNKSNKKWAFPEKYCIFFDLPFGISCYNVSLLWNFHLIFP